MTEKRPGGKDGLRQMNKAVRLDLGRLATFVPNKQLPVYNWFYFKEGFARDLVTLLLDRYVGKNGQGGNSNVLDPFVGSGTTLVACKERGLDSYGFDVSPLAILASRAKTNDYDVDELKQSIKLLSKSKFQKPDTSAIPKEVRRYFNKHTLDDVMFFRKQVGQFSGEIQDFVKLGLITSTTKCSYMYKDGAVLKIRKKPVPVFRKFYIRTLRKMLADVQKTEPKFKQCQTFVDEGDARNLKIDSQFIDLVITSPPYMNKIEYTKIYGVEEFLFFGVPFEKRGLRSYVGSGVKPDAEAIFPDQSLPPAANAYFADMSQVFSELRRVCKPGAVLAFVIGDGCFPTLDGRLDDDGSGRHASGRVVHADALLPRLAQDQGFETEQVYVLNERWCTKNRVEKVGKMEESLIIMRKI